MSENMSNGEEQNEHVDSNNNNTLDASISYIYQLGVEILTTDFNGSNLKRTVTYRTLVDVPEDDPNDESGFQKREAVSNFWKNLANEKSVSMDSIVQVSVISAERTERIGRFEVVDVQSENQME